jgi:hypothetical protein
MFLNFLKTNAPRPNMEYSSLDILQVCGAFFLRKSDG